MGQLIRSLSNSIRRTDGARFRVAVDGQQRVDGKWDGWLQFKRVRGKQALQTDRETVQTDETGLAYWASGLEPAYLEGAFERARTGRSVRAALNPTLELVSR